ncbi:hypothetical protein SAMN03159335_06323 [Burkholderia cepacia]|uniref:hypothetical protein n=1 Tax=Burkholderia cepacia TaxID=292 RepID=UPI0008C00D00|nr:hypothetical protein [Burkholderia cepacia]SEU40491.1 hypothetical protein SAMN03159335_06323 [Burkholderia cepacia]
MSATKAAAALVQFDLATRELIEQTFDGREHFAVPYEEKFSVIRAIAGTWTLSLAAASAGVTEEAVLVALVRDHLHCGTIQSAKSAVYSALKG